MTNPSKLQTHPLVTDRKILSDIICEGSGLAKIDKNSLHIDPCSLKCIPLNDNINSLMTRNKLLIPAYANRFVEVNMAQPGGCAIGIEKDKGKRPVIHIIKILDLFGYTGYEYGGRIFVQKCPYPSEVIVDINYFSYSSEKRTSPYMSGATKTALVLSTKLIRTIIKNPYYKSDVKDIVRFLKNCNFQINISKKFIKIENNISKNKKISRGS